jgi:putative transposase
MEQAVEELTPVIGTRPACRALGVAPATIYRRRRPPERRPKPRLPPPRALSPEERDAVVEVLHSDRFVDCAPAQVWATLLWSYYYLYVILDVFSRYVIGWTVQHRESASVAEQLIAQAVSQQGISPGQLTIHADRGSAMRSKPVAFLLADLGVTRTHSRPYTSTDNPYSEAQFRTLKYRPGFPERFGSIVDSRGFCRPFFDWYNHDHRHSGLGLMTPASVHYQQASGLHAERARVLAAAYAERPERFVRGMPRPPELPTAVWINRPSTPEGAQ